MKETFSKTVNGNKCIWNVAALIEAARGLEARQINISELKELDRNYWFTTQQPTIRNCVAHMKKIMDADLSFPVILDPDGDLMDGGHRVAKALYLGEETIMAVQLGEYPKPEVSMRGATLMLGKFARPVITDKK